jgi:predicted esterase
MNSRSFDQLHSQIQDLYQHGRYSDALDLISEQSAHFPQHKPVLDYWNATLYAETGQTDRTFTILEQAIDTGFWFSDALMVENPALKDLLERSDYNALIEKNRELRIADPAASFPTLTLRPEGLCQEGDPPCPLLLTLHANASSARESLRFWQSAGEEGWLVAAPQSTQAIWKDAYIWQDVQKSFEHINQQFHSLKTQYDVQDHQVVIAGQSRGAEIAIQMFLSGEIQTCGFIAVEPSNLTIENLREWMLDDVIEMPRELRAVIYISKDSETTRKNYIHNVAEYFTEMGIICRVETYRSDQGNEKLEDENSLAGVLAFLSR